MTDDRPKHKDPIITANKYLWKQRLVFIIPLWLQCKTGQIWQSQDNVFQWDTVCVHYDVVHCDGVRCDVTHRDSVCVGTAFWGWKSRSSLSSPLCAAPVDLLDSPHLQVLHRSSSHVRRSPSLRHNVGRMSEWCPFILTCQAFSVSPT